MHAPMWLGDTETARRMARHLRNIHTKVAGDVIDVGQPELGGYAASGPRDAMWAAPTEMHSMLWLYESLAFRSGRLPHRLSPEKRDRYIAETAAYCRLVGADEDEIPTTMAELAALYEKYDDLFGLGRSMTVYPDTGEDFAKAMAAGIKKNFHRSQLKALFLTVVLDHGLFRQIAIGASSGRTRRSMGYGPLRARLSVLGAKLSLPLVWLLQRGPFERYYMRLMWGPDGVALIQSARVLQAKVRAERATGRNAP
ncbi:oxygenase MpaB family protein [Streptomyces sp. NPDC059894]|uniref:oxygenase MpaB family protein n=1 Tax=unclassified Streptomyces TaxID=2593676 RepID=UPI0036672E6F